MSDNECTDINSHTIEQKIDNNSKQIVQKIKNKSNQSHSKSKKQLRKSMAPKTYLQIKEIKQQNTQLSFKQIKLTQLWKKSSQIPQQQIKVFSQNELQIKAISQQLQQKNRLISTTKQQKEQIKTKYQVLQNENKLYTYKSQDIIKKILLDSTEAKRRQRYTVNYQYGYFKDHQHKNFVFGPFVNQIHQTIQEKTKRIEQLKIQMLQANGKNKQMLQFAQKFYQKVRCYHIQQIDELKQQLKRRQKIVNNYKDKIIFSHLQSQSYYSIMGWPTIGQKDRFQTLQLLGCGGFGSVYKCFDLFNNTFVALKQNKFISTIGIKNQQQKLNYLKHMKRQVKIQKNLNHPNIAKLIQILKMDENQVSFVMQYLQGPQLGKYLKQNQCIQQVQAKQIIKQIICALKYLYQQDNKIIHYDLKPSNIMFNQGIVKIVDFGLCKQMETDDTRIGLTSYGVGTYYYLPPQTFLQEKSEVSPKVDIWSVGVVFFQLLYGKKPFGHGIPQAKVYNSGLILNAKKVQFPTHTPLKYKVSEAAKNFIKDCLKYKQQQRLSPLEAYQHQYLK